MTIMTLFYSEAREQNGKFFSLIEHAHNKRTIELRYIANLVHDNSTHTILPNHYTHPGYHEMPPHAADQCFFFAIGSTCGLISEELPSLISIFNLRNFLYFEGTYSVRSLFPYFINVVDAFC